MKPEIKQVAAILSNPSSSEPAGRVTIGRYILEDGLITMVDGKATRGTSGKRITHHLLDGEAPELIAERLTMKIYRSRSGNDLASFNRPLSYPVLHENPRRNLERNDGGKQGMERGQPVTLMSLAMVLQTK